MTQSLQIQDQNFVLHPSGAMLWEEKSMLLISDVHLGKVSHFRKFGSAVPPKAIQKNFDLMNEAIAFFQPGQLVFLGDLFHSSLNKEWQLFEKWTTTLRLKIILVVGNHDIISPIKYEDLGIQVVSEIGLDGFLLTHHPEERDGFFNFSGHIHPAVRLKGVGRQSLRLSCFYKNTNQMILPAFGEFTGSHILKRKKHNEIFAIAENNVIKI
ncbi:MAG: ligase-associated DNA damage response endonuclease PdeM [Aurantibacter sp.]